MTQEPNTEYTKILKLRCQGFRPEKQPQKNQSDITATIIGNDQIDTQWKKRCLRRIDSLRRDWRPLPPRKGCYRSASPWARSLSYREREEKQKFKGRIKSFKIREEEGRSRWRLFFDFSLDLVASLVAVWTKQLYQILILKMLNSSLK